MLTKTTTKVKVPQRPQTPKLQIINRHSEKTRNAMEWLAQNLLFIKTMILLSALFSKAKWIGLLALGVGISLVGFGQDEILLYENDFEIFAVEPVRGCYIDLDQRDVNELYYQTGNGTSGIVDFSQTFTVETILVNGSGNLYLDPRGTAGNYCIGLFAEAQDDLLSLTFNAFNKDSINISFDLSAISISSDMGCGEGRVSLNPKMSVAVYETPNGIFNISSFNSYTLLDQTELNGIVPGSTKFEFNWTRVDANLNIQNSVDGRITVLLNLIENYYGAFDNLRITASETCDTTEINLENGLVAHYPFEADATDVSTNTNDGEIFGATLTTDRFGIENNAFHFDGSSHISIIDHPTLRPQNFTISLWCRFDDLSGNLHLIDKHFGTGFFNSYEIWFQDNTIQAALSNGNSFGPFLEKELMPDSLKWYHIVYSFSDENDVSNLYLNGKVVDSEVGPTTIAYDTEPLLIGASNDFQTPQSFFKGDIDDVRIYDRVLSSCEIEALFEMEYVEYSCPRDDSPIDLNQNLIAYYPFNGNSNDESENSNNGEVFEATLTTDQFGNENSVYQFDGDDDYINYRDVNDFGTSDFSISVWIEATLIDSSLHKIVNKGLTTNGTPGNAGYGLRLENPDKLTFSIGNNNAQTTKIETNNIELNKQYHIVAVRTNTNLLLYLNGEVVAMGESSEIYDTETNVALSVGALLRPNGDFNEFFNGKIDDIILYNRALNECEIEAIYEGEKPVSFISPENTALTCSDGIDNDGDGMIDCDEPDCSGILPGYNKNECVPCLLDPTSFADSVSIFETLCTFPQEFDEILGPPDAGEGSVSNMLSLGGEGRVVVIFTDNLLVNSGTIAPDIYVFESGGQPEVFEVALRPLNDLTENRIEQLGVMPNENGFYSIGEIVGQPSSVDIDSLFSGYSYSELKFDAVEIIDVKSPDPDWDDCDENYDGADIDAVCALSSIIPIEGCTNPTACNYNPQANINDDSCIFETTCSADCILGDIEIWNTETCQCEVQTTTVLGCTDQTAENYDPSTNCDDGSCEYDNCNQIYSNNFDMLPTSNWENAKVETLIDQTLLGRYANESTTLILNDLPTHSFVNICFDLWIFDSWDGNDTNYGPDIFKFTVEDSLILNTTFNPVNVQSFPNNYISNSVVNNNATSGAYSLIQLNADQWNYPEAKYKICKKIDHNKRDVSFSFNSTESEGLWDEPWALDNITVSLDGFYFVPQISEHDCTTNSYIVDYEPINGTSPYQTRLFNLDTVISDFNNVPPGIYNFEITDANGCYWNEVIVLEEVVYGCTNANATNYNPDAVCDNGNCEIALPILGCSNPTACNYNPYAVDDDNSCFYPIACYLTCQNTVIPSQLPGTLCENNPAYLINYRDANCDCVGLNVAINCILEPVRGNVVGEEFCFKITVLDTLNGNNEPLANMPVNFVVSGVNEGLYDFDFSDENGIVELCYTPTNPGQDYITITSGDFTFTFINIVFDFDGGFNFDLDFLLSFGHIYNEMFYPSPPDRLPVNDSLCTTITIMAEDSVTVIAGVQVTIISTIDGVDEVLVDYVDTTNLYGQIEFCFTSPYIGIEECILTTPFSSDTIRYNWVEIVEAPTCTDNIQNGNETGIDCGGNCPACPTEPTPGCTDSNFCEYNPDATADDGSCQTPNADPGICNDNCNFDILEEWNPQTCACQFVRMNIRGCMDEMAVNYNPNANCETADVCYYPNTEAVFPCNLLGDWEVIDACSILSDYEQQVPYDVEVNSIRDNNTILNFTNLFGVGYDIIFEAIIDNDQVIIPTTELWFNSISAVGILSENEDTINWEFTIDIDSAISTCNLTWVRKSVPLIFEGCTDFSANNYDSRANCDDGNCTYDNQTPTCSDNLQNGNETGVDCGGDCEDCPTDPTPTPNCINNPVVINHNVDCSAGNGTYNVQFSVSGGGAGAQGSTYQITGDYTGTVVQGEVYSLAALAEGTSYSLTVIEDGFGCTASINKGPNNCSKVPIELLHFSGEVLTEGNLLKWSTATEIENEYFGLYRSIDGVDYELINQQKGAGTVSTTQQYQFLDRSALSGIHYYQLQQTDFDGTTTTVGNISLQRGEMGLAILNIIPIPVTDQFDLILTNNQTEPVQIEIHNHIGQLVYRQTYSLNPQLNVLQLNVQDLTGGVYLLSVKATDKVVSQKLLKH